jgi:asparagine synthase (glutamine-hydrolysing)
MIADVPLGAFLSGGIDSSLVVAAMARQSSRPVRTFSVGFTTESFNELPFARLVAEAYGTDHTEILLEPAGLDVLPDLVRHYGEPFADSSALATYALAKTTREHVTVALSGDGGDEAFAGYDRYMEIQRLMGLLAITSKASGFFDGILRPSSGLPPWSFPRRIRGALDLYTGDEALRYSRVIAFFREYEKDFLFTAEVNDQLIRDNAVVRLRRLFQECAATHPVDRMTAVDMLSYLPDDILVKVDIASMANSLETRSPFLDHSVLEFGAALPAEQRFSHGKGKQLPRLLARRLLPPAVIDRPKQGFAIPIRHWFRSDSLPYLKDVLLDDRSLARGYFKPEAVHALVSAHASGRANLEYRLWALLNLELWHREFIDG